MTSGNGGIVELVSRLTKRNPVLSALGAVLVVAVLLSGAYLYLVRAERTNQTQQRPRRVEETPRPSSGPPGTINVPAGGNLQAALNSAKCGDTISLQPGGVYKPTGDSFVLPQKKACTGSDADFITIQTSNLAGIPPAGQRVDPARHAAAMPKLTGTKGTFVIIAEAGAHHYKFVGVEITTDGNTYTPDLVNLGSYFTREQRLSTNNFVFDRIFAHSPEVTPNNLFPTSVDRTVGRGLALSVSNVSVINSYLAGFSGHYPKAHSAAGQNIDSYGIYSDAGPGPIKIINNYIEAQFSNVFIGGAGMNTTNNATISNATTNSARLSNVANLAVGDLVAFSYSACTPAVGPNGYAKPWETGKVTSISGNTINFTIVRGQNSCNPGPPDNGGTARWNGDLIRDVEIRRNTLNKPDIWNAFSNPKNWIEIKTVKGAVIDGNDMYSGVGTNIAITIRNQDGASPWATIEDVTFTNNRISGYKGGFGLMLTDNEQPSLNGSNIVIKNNLFIQPRPIQGYAANFVQLVGGHGIVVQHNTIVQPGSPVVSDIPTTGFVFKDNIIANYQYGMQCTIPSGGMAACWPRLAMTGNLIIDTRSDKSDGSLAARYPAGNFYVNSPSEIGFVDLANQNYRLAPSSKFRGRASDGTDPGCDINALEAALAGK